MSHWSAVRRWILGLAVALAIAGGVYALRCRESATPRDVIVMPVSKSRARLRELQLRPPAGIAGTVIGAPSAVACARPALDAGALYREIEDADRAIRCAATTGGRYELADLAAGRWVVWASAEGRRGARQPLDGRTRSGQIVTLAPGERRTVDLALEDGGASLTGFVRDVRGKPIANAWVHVQAEHAPPEYTARSAADGSFTAWTVQDAVTLVAVADGFVSANLAAPAPAQGLAFALLPEAVLAGIVVDAATRAPVANATVNAGGTTAPTDDDGRFRVTKLEPGRYKPSATAIGKYGEAGESLLLGLGRTVEDLVIEVHPVAVVAGRIVTPSGPCAEDRGHAFLSRRGGGAWYWADTTGDGDVLLEGVVPGAYEVLVDCDGWLAQLPYPDLVVGNSDVEDVTWSVIAGARITGRVTDGERPIAGAVINYYGGDRTRVGSTGTGGDGRYVADGVAPGTIELEARAEGFLSRKVEVVATVGAPGTADLALARGAKLAGRVVDAGGKPVANARVRAGDNATHTDLRGEFAMTGIEPGSYLVTTVTGWDKSDEPRPERSKRVTVAIDQPARVELVAELPDGVVTGVVVDHRGAPVGDAYVDVARDHLEPRRRYFQGERMLVATDGSFRITGLPDGALAVRAQRRGGSEGVVTGITAGAQVRIVLPPTGSIAGTIVDSTGKPADDVQIEARDRALDHHRSERIFRTGGKFTLRDLPAGTYQLQADDDPRSAITVTLGAGEARDGVRIVVQQRYTLRGRLVDSRRKPLAGWKIEVPHLHATWSTSSGTKVITSTDEVAITAADGSFLVQHLAGETATVSAGEPGSALREVATIPLRGASPIDAGEIVVPDR